jgi:hypothetical protein
MTLFPDSFGFIPNPFVPEENSDPHDYFTGFLVLTSQIIQIASSARCAEMRYRPGGGALSISGCLGSSFAPSQPVLPFYPG